MLKLVVRVVTTELFKVNLVPRMNRAVFRNFGNYTPLNLVTFQNIEALLNIIFLLYD
jgi:hypothetical protein